MRIEGGVLQLQQQALCVDDWRKIVDTDVFSAALQSRPYDTRHFPKVCVS